MRTPETNLDNDNAEESVQTIHFPRARRRIRPASGSGPGGSNDRDPDSDTDSDSESEDDIMPGRTFVEVVDDLSEPDEDELRKMEASPEISAADHAHFEKRFFTDLDDPEYVPKETGRIHWIVPQIHGSRDKPLKELVLRSPTVRIGGFDFRIKFYPQGNRSDFMSAYIECVRSSVAEVASRQGDGVTVDESSESSTPSHSVVENRTVSPASVDFPTESSISGAPATSSEPVHVIASTSTHDSNSDTSTSEDQATPTSTTLSTTTSVACETQSETEHWFVPAQFGLVMYNPEEPRVHVSSGNQHQFSETDPDWGWTRFHKPHLEAHRRVRGQRKALIRNDTVAFTAYVRLIQDETEGLWNRNECCTFGTAGVHPMHTSSTIWASGAIAPALSAWTSLGAFRRIINGAPVDPTETVGNPQKLVAALQVLIHRLYRDSYPNADISSIQDYSRRHRLALPEVTDVIECWEILRRRIETELEGTEMQGLLGDLFDGSITRQLSAISERTENISLSAATPPAFRIPVGGNTSMQAAMAQTLNGNDKVTRSTISRFPKFLQVELDRHVFDETSKTWRKLVNKIKLDEKIDLRRWRASDDETESRYILYGFIVHEGEINSGHFYPVLRPHGPGTRWLMNFDLEGDAGKVRALTQKQVEERYQGVVAGTRAEGTEAVPYVVMYVRNDVIKDVLQMGKTDTVPTPTWIVEGLPSMSETLADDRPRNLTVYHSALVKRQSGMGVFDLGSLPTAEEYPGEVFELTCDDSEITTEQLQVKLAPMIGNVFRPSQCELFYLNFNTARQYQSWHLPLHRPIRSFGQSADTDLFLMVHVISPKDATRLEPTRIPPLSPPMRAAGATDTVEAEPEQEHREEAEGDEEQIIHRRSEDLDTLLEELSNFDAAVLPSPGVSGIPSSAALILSDTPPLLTAGLQDTGGVQGLVEIPGQAIVAEGGISDVISSNDGVIPAIIDGSRISATSSASTTAPEQTLDEAALSAVSSTPSFPTTISSAVREGMTTSPQATPIILSTSEEVDTDVPVSSIPPPPPPAPAAVLGFSSTPTSEAPIPTQSAPVRRRSRRSSETLQFPTNPWRYALIRQFSPRDRSLTSKGIFQAEADEPIRDFVSRALGMGDDGEIRLYRHDREYDGKLLSGDEALSGQSVDIIVFEEVLSIDERQAHILSATPSTYSAHMSNLTQVARHPPSHSSSLDATTHVPVTRNYFGSARLQTTMLNHLPHGLNCTVISLDCSRYVGALASSLRHGQGTMTFASGDVYTGTWSQDTIDGHGKMVYAATGNIYIGGFRRGSRHGKGVMYYEHANEDGDMCQICYEEEMNALFYDCGHFVACIACAGRVELCPICRAPIKKVVRVYRSL